MIKFYILCVTHLTIHIERKIFFYFYISFYLLKCVNFVHDFTIFEHKFLMYYFNYIFFNVLWKHGTIKNIFFFVDSIMKIYIV